MDLKIKSRLNSRASLLAIIVITLFQLTSCGGKGDPTPSAQDVVKAKLISNTWKVQSVSVDNVDQTIVYKGLTLNFTATNFSTTNGAAAWPSSGTWSFNSTDGSSILRSDGITIAVEVTDTTLRLTFTWSKTTLGGGRIESVGGVNVFNFVK
jgi:hypothetical protein